ncbi:MAG: ATP-binding protein, partial [Flavobacterium piscis]|nr:ATP-binding protein [Flavobacterium piscis]
MLRSPFLCFIIFLLVLSCKETTPPIHKKNVSEEGYNLREKGLSDLENKNFNSAFYNFNKSKIAFETTKDSANIVYNLIQMATIQQINGDYYGSK